MREHEAAKPLAQDARLCRDSVEFARNGAGSHGFYDTCFNQSCLFKPGEEIMSVAEPLDLAAPGCRYRVQKVEAACVGNEHGGGAGISHGKLLRESGMGMELQNLWSPVKVRLTG